MHGDDRGGVLTYYPLGSIYQTTDSNFNPNTSWGGTWELLKDVFLVGAGNLYKIGATGGEASHHLTSDELPINAFNISSAFDGCTDDAPEPWSYKMVWTYGGKASAGYWPLTCAPKDQPHNNLPPYLAVNTWHRTA